MLGERASWASQHSQAPAASSGPHIHMLIQYSRPCPSGCGARARAQVCGWFCAIAASKEDLLVVGAPSIITSCSFSRSHASSATLTAGSCDTGTCSPPHCTFPCWLPQFLCAFEGGWSQVCCSRVFVLCLHCRAVFNCFQLLVHTPHVMVCSPSNSTAAIFNRNRTVTKTAHTK